MLQRLFLLLSLLGCVAGCAAEAGPTAYKTPADLDALVADTDSVVNAGAADSARRPTLLGSIANGESKEASFGRNKRFLAWNFEAASGATIRLTAQGATNEDLDTVLFLYRATAAGNPSGAALATNDDAGSSGLPELASLLELTAPAAGKYVALVRLYDEGTSGRVRLALSLGRACGSRGLAACGEGEYCEHSIEAACGETDAPGTCAVKPDVCTREARPVCGCDGNTYGNACNAAAAGVSVRSEGVCPEAPRSCGTRGAGTCGEGEFCKRAPEANCGRADAPGVCEAIPTVCPRIFRPVCGCDGETYGNSCQAWAAGVSVDYDGACRAAGTSCGGLIGGLCGDAEFCNYAPEDGCGFADQTGICAPKPELCTREFNPVCGCDNRTYSNACNANAAGVSVAREGACAPLARTCGGLLGTSCGEGEYCNFPSETMCGSGDQTGTCENKPDFCTANYAPVCGCDGRTYSNACRAAAAGQSVRLAGACH